ncbi:MAG: ribonuclease protein component [Tenuifilum sp.]|uniref:ribonuclease P protein component n=1 Tax=Tenuifilum sp. TaxID=2760880 RepID=UPI0024ABA5E1|nr:ribonuclease P protein component [Tenuifilum sp.]MDI3527053.1 ribonuclease protein component [Tenuifilum sp.]
MNFRLRKKNILHLESEVSDLLKSELNAFKFPVKLVYKFKTNDSSESMPFKVLFIVPKRYLKKAFKRNLIRRRMKEAFRLNQEIISKSIPQNTTVLLALIYVSKDEVSFKHIQDSIVYLLKQIDLNEGNYS